jgi:hypothetical protein
VVKKKKKRTDRMQGRAEGQSPSTAKGALQRRRRYRRKREAEKAEADKSKKEGGGVEL